MAYRFPRVLQNTLKIPNPTYLYRQIIGEAHKTVPSRSFQSSHLSQTLRPDRYRVYGHRREGFSHYGRQLSQVLIPHLPRRSTCRKQLAGICDILRESLGERLMELNNHVSCSHRIRSMRSGLRTSTAIIEFTRRFSIRRSSIRRSETKSGLNSRMGCLIRQPR